jgi:hypothetical protein
MSALLLALVVATEPAPPGEADDRAAAFLQPLLSVRYGLRAAVAVSAGGQLVHSERWSLTFDLAVVWGPGDQPTETERFPGGLSVAGSLGPSWRIWGTGLRGLFLTPKVYVVSNASNQVPRGTLRTGQFPGPGTPRDRWNSGELGLAVDVGFQWTFGRFFLGSVLGVGAGWYLGQNPQGFQLPISSFGGALFTDEPSRASGPVLALNLHLLRLGVVF